MVGLDSRVAKKFRLTRERYSEILAHAQAFAPKLFKEEGPLPPLALGISKIMNERGFREQYSISSREFGTFMHWYTSQTKYLYQVAKRWMRVDLEGEFTEKVTEEESKQAIQQLKERGINFVARKRKPKKPKSEPDLSRLVEKFNSN